MSMSPKPRDPDQVKEAKELYLKHVAQAWVDQQASSDAYDNNLLTFSSAALGISLVFIKDVVPLENAEWLKILFTSWGAFAGCIFVTIASFQFSNQAQRAVTRRLSDYYLKADESALDRKDIWNLLLPWCAGIGAACLLTGVICTLIFASKNMNHFKELKRWQKTPAIKQMSLPN